MQFFRNQKGQVEGKPAMWVLEQITRYHGTPNQL